MFKLMGIGMIFCACSAAGFLKAGEVRDRKRLLIDFKDMLHHISTEIDYFKAPLPQVFERLSAGDDRESRLLLRCCCLSYRKENQNLQVMWSAAADEIYKGTALTDEDISIIKRCGEFLGQSDFKGQQNHFSLWQQRLDRQIAEAEEAARTKGAMYGKMGVSMGAVLAVCLL